MADYDLLVVGGGPAGYTAALTAAERGARVALAEAEQPGGTCVHFACIPTNALLASADGFLAASGLAGTGHSAGEDFLFGRAADRAGAVVRAVAGNVRAALAQRKVALLRARAAFAGTEGTESVVRLVLQGSQSGDAGEVSAEAAVIASGARWHLPTIAGLPAERLLSVDQLLARRAAPASAVVLADGPGDSGFAIEYAFLLAVAGTRVTLLSARERLLPGLDAALAEIAGAVLTELGVGVRTGAEILSGSAGGLVAGVAGERSEIDAEVVVSVDARRPMTEGLGLERLGLAADAAIPIDGGCRTSAANVLAAGDVTGGAMLSAAALRMGTVAAVNATGGELVLSHAPIPRLLHTVPAIGWIGRTEEAARAAGYDICTGVVDLGYSPRALALGLPAGLVKVVAERELGEILGVHVVAPEASEIIAAAALAIEAEMTLDDLAAVTHWHPSVAESLTEAARRALRTARR